MPLPAPVDDVVVLGILRLSHKYGVNYLLNRAIVHLETIYRLDRTIYCTLSSEEQPHQQRPLAFHLMALPILTEVGATWLLPMAYYGVGTHSLSELRSAGSFWDDLPAGIRVTCLPLAGIQREAILTLTRFVADRCDAQHFDCDMQRLRMISAVVARRGSFLRGAQDPLVGWNENGWQEIEATVCSSCLTRFKVEQHTAFNEVWDMLPQNCGLEGWDALLQRRKEVMG
jgi:hypothetical protein